MRLDVHKKATKPKIVACLSHFPVRFVVSSTPILMPKNGDKDCVVKNTPPTASVQAVKQQSHVNSRAT